MYRLSICDYSKSKSAQSVLCGVDAVFDTLIIPLLISGRPVPPDARFLFFILEF